MTQKLRDSTSNKNTAGSGAAHGGTGVTGGRAGDGSDGGGTAPIPARIFLGRRGRLLTGA